MNPNLKNNKLYNMGRDSGAGLGANSIHSTNNLKESGMPSFSALQKGRRVSGLMKFDQTSAVAGQPITNSHVGPVRRPGSKGLGINQNSERSYHPAGIGAQISGQNFYRAGGIEGEAGTLHEKPDGPFKKLKVNAEYL
jgi:hypothetical protein